MRSDCEQSNCEPAYICLTRVTENANEAHSMNVVRTSWVLTLTGLFAFFTFAGDIIADSIADLQGDHCVSESSQSDPHQEKTPCSHCSCAVHNGTVIASTAMLDVCDAFKVVT